MFESSTANSVYFNRFDGCLEDICENLVNFGLDAGVIRDRNRGGWLGSVLIWTETASALGVSGIKQGSVLP